VITRAACALGVIENNTLRQRPKSKLERNLLRGEGIMPVAPLMILWAIDTLLLIKELFTIFALSKVKDAGFDAAH
jgi:hypothetical protein